MPHTEFSDAAARVARLPFEFDYEFDLFRRGRRDHFRVALLVPLCGSAGLWTPSAIACAQLAVEELNNLHGIRGRQVQLILVNAAEEAQRPVEDVINQMIEADAVDAVVGMHLSSVRQRVARVVSQRVPFVYTPLYEGGERTPGVFTIGETPDFQLGPALDFIQQSYRVKRWALIGSDYVWPRASNVYAKQKIKSFGGDLVYERYAPFGLKDMRTYLQDLERANPDLVLMSLVGQEAVEFNRLFGRMGLHRQMVRMSSGLEENGLLASGANGLKRLYSSSAYYGTLHTEANAAFREKYYNMHGDTAPQLNTLGQSVYEGLQFLAAMSDSFFDDWRHLSSRDVAVISYPSARWLRRRDKRLSKVPMYLARTDDIKFEVIKML